MVKRLGENGQVLIPSTPGALSTPSGVLGTIQTCVGLYMRLRVRYSGRVQGVGFRATAQAAASGWPVTGWVRNEFDGSVMMEVQGAPEAVEGVLAALGDRMRRNITRAERTPIDHLPEEVGFVIRRS